MRKQTSGSAYIPKTSTNRLRSGAKTIGGTKTTTPTVGAVNKGAISSRRVTGGRTAPITTPGFKPGTARKKLY